MKLFGETGRTSREIIWGGLAKIARCEHPARHATIEDDATEPEYTVRGLRLWRYER